MAWDGEAGNLDWSDPRNWDSPANDRLPGALDDVVIDLPSSATIELPKSVLTLKSLQSQASIMLASGSLTVTGASSISGDFSMAPGATLKAVGATASFLASGATTIDGANLLATGGGVISLPKATS